MGLFTNVDRSLRLEFYFQLVSLVAVVTYIMLATVPNCLFRFQ